LPDSYATASPHFHQPRPKDFAAEAAPSVLSPKVREDVVVIGAAQATQRRGLPPFPPVQSVLSAYLGGVSEDFLDVDLHLPQEEGGDGVAFAFLGQYRGG